MSAPSNLGLIIFDLDGTLIDSAADLTASVNATLQEWKQPALGQDRVAAMVGDGAQMLVQRALGLPAQGLNKDQRALLAEALEYFLAYYRRHNLDRTRLYEGVGEGILALSQRFQLAVLSNKPVRPCREILQGLGVAEYFVEICGGDSFERKKPDPTGIQWLLERTCKAPGEALMVGDSRIDVLTGRNAGIWTCGVTYGFAPPGFEFAAPDWKVDSFGELAAQLRDGSKTGAIPGVPTPALY